MGDSKLTASSGQYFKNTEWALIEARRYEKTNQVAMLSLTIFPKDNPKETLASSSEQTEAFERKHANESASEFSSSEPVNSEIAGQPAIDVDHTITKYGRIMHQPTVLMVGKTSTCQLTYTALDPYFDKYKIDFLRARNSRRCP